LGRADDESGVVENSFEKFKREQDNNQKDSDEEILMKHFSRGDLTPNSP